MENSLSSIAFASHGPQVVDLAAIEHELARFWYDPEALDGGTPVTRACMANLVIFCRNTCEEQEITQEIPVIVAQHPSRVLLLVADANSQSAGLRSPCAPGVWAYAVCRRWCVPCSSAILLRRSGGPFPKPRHCPEPSLMNSLTWLIRLFTIVWPGLTPYIS